MADFTKERALGYSNLTKVLPIAAQRRETGIFAIGFTEGGRWAACAPLFDDVAKLLLST